MFSNGYFKLVTHDDKRWLENSLCSQLTNLKKDKKLFLTSHSNLFSVFSPPAKLCAISKFTFVDNFSIRVLNRRLFVLSGWTLSDAETQKALWPCHLSFRRTKLIKEISPFLTNLAGIFFQHKLLCDSTWQNAENKLRRVKHENTKKKFRELSAPRKRENTPTTDEAKTLKHMLMEKKKTFPPSL